MNRKNSRRRPGPKRIRTAEGLFTLSYPPADIRRKTKTIYNKILSRSRFLDKGNFTRISSLDLQVLFGLYDHYFFNDYFSKHYGERISFRLSKRMTKAGGKTSYWKNSGAFEICLSTTLIFQTFGDISRKVVVSGIPCNDRLEAVMRIMEHEIIHLLELVVKGKSSCSRPQFRKLSKVVFNHAGVTHDLVTHVEKARAKYDLKVGDSVVFDFEGKTLMGKIHRITKRATVMVENERGGFIDRQGKRYAKYYIPLPWLKSVKNK